jgi:GxxExxY protein
MDLTENQISKIIVDRSFKVHRALGPGLLESSYENCLYLELARAKLNVER